MIHFFDSSAPLKLFFEEPGTVQLRRLFEPLETPGKALSVIGALEVRSAIRRRERTGEIPSAAAAEILGLFEEECLRMSFQPINEVALAQAKEAVDRHPLRSLDAIQLGSCLAVRQNSGGKSVVFVCSDRRLLDAAVAEGLEVLNPTE